MVEGEDKSLSGSTEKSLESSRCGKSVLSQFFDKWFERCIKVVKAFVWWRCIPRLHSLTGAQSTTRGGPVGAAAVFVLEYHWFDPRRAYF